MTVLIPVREDKLQPAFFTALLPLGVWPKVDDVHRPGVVIHLVKQPVFAAIELLEMGIGRLEAFELSRNRVERANRTFREEFYDCSTATPTVAGFRADLLAWEPTYNHIHPHQALGYLTPAEFLVARNATNPKEEVSRAS